MVLIEAGFAALILIFSAGNGNLWSTVDHKVMDSFHKLAVSHGFGPEPSFSPGIVYLAITDRYYNTTGSNILDRRDMGKINKTLKKLDPTAVIYDIIFARPSDQQSDLLFKKSLSIPPPVFLPVGSALAQSPSADAAELENLIDRYTPGLLGTPSVKGNGEPYYSQRILFQYKPFTGEGIYSGDISAPSDADSVNRHVVLVIKVNRRYLPGLSLSIFLKWAGISFNDVTVHWGRHIRIPAEKSDVLEKDMVIPIDRSGRAYIPFVAPIGKDFPIVPVHRFLQNRNRPELEGNYRDFFQDRFVFICETATGTSDLGSTPLERDIPLVTAHTSMLNALLTQTFYRKWGTIPILGTIAVIFILMGCASAFTSARIFYMSGPFFIAGIFVHAGYQFIHFSLFPVVWVAMTAVVLFCLLTANLEMSASKERIIVQNTFAKYVPEKVVKKLLSDPEAVKLGGESRVVTVLFSDIEGFTKISETLPPHDLVSLINEYLTEMTDIVLAHNGIIDKYQGDAIMAEFGIPLPVENHADQAVRAALKMQERLVRLKREWSNRLLPPLSCRIGINTGEMLVGNMGSTQIYDYTVMGDAVNLSARLESVNKIYGTGIIISAYTFDHLTEGVFKTRILDVIAVKGKSEAVRVYEVYGFQAEIPEDPPADMYREQYHAAYEQYLERNFKKAEQLFEKALEIKAGDPAAGMMLKRIQQIDPGSIEKDWDGSVRLTQK